MTGGTYAVESAITTSSGVTCIGVLALMAGDFSFDWPRDFGDVLRKLYPFLISDKSLSIIDPSSSCGIGSCLAENIGRT